jgi:hypothetical protein
MPSMVFHENNILLMSQNKLFNGYITKGEEEDCDVN